MRGIMDSGRIGKIRAESWHVRIHSEHEFGSIRQWSDAIGFTIFRRSISYSFSTVDWIREQDIFVFKVFRICTRYLKRRTFSRLFKSEEQCFIEYIPPHRYSALLSSPSLVKTFSTYFKFLANPLAKRQFLGRTISTRKKIDRSKLVRSLFSSPRELNSRIYGDVSATEFTWKQLNLFRGNGFIKSGKCLSFIEAPRKAIYNLV